MLADSLRERNGKSSKLMVQNDNQLYQLINWSPVSRFPRVTRNANWTQESWSCCTCSTVRNRAFPPRGATERWTAPWIRHCTAARPFCRRSRESAPPCPPWAGTAARRWWPWASTSGSHTPRGPLQRSKKYLPGTFSFIDQIHNNNF